MNHDKINLSETINELACKIASKRLYDNWSNKDGPIAVQLVSETSFECRLSALTIYSDKAQDKFNELYDEAEEMIRSLLSICEGKTSLKERHAFLSLWLTTLR